MALHSSLKVDPAAAQQRTVLTRIERIKELMKKGLWTQEQRVFGLPKTKVIRIKSGKSKSKTEDAAAAGEAGAATAAAKPEAAAKSGAAATKPGAAAGKPAVAAKPVAGKK